jgi:hypothetical protein
MKGNSLVTILLLGASLCYGLTPVGLNPISPAQLTKGKVTTYEFQFLLSQSVTTKATIDIGFPAEFNYTALAARLSCMYRTNTTSWSYYSCSLVKYTSKFT